MFEGLKGLNINLDFHFEPATLDRIQRNLNERCHVVDVAEKEVKPKSLTNCVNDSSFAFGFTSFSATSTT